MACPSLVETIGAVMNRQTERQQSSPAAPSLHRRSSVPFAVFLAGCFGWRGGGGKAKAKGKAGPSQEGK